MAPSELRKREEALQNVLEAIEFHLEPEVEE